MGANESEKGRERERERFQSAIKLPTSGELFNVLAFTK